MYKKHLLFYHISILSILIMCISIVCGLDHTAEFIGASYLHDAGYKGSGTTICVIDSGVDYTHESLGDCTTSEFLAGNCYQIIGGIDYCGDEPMCNISNMDNDSYDLPGGQVCNNGQCGNSGDTDLMILDIIPIQVLPDVDMVKDKSGFVRVIVFNDGPNDAHATVTVTFDSNQLEPASHSSDEADIDNKQSYNFDFDCDFDVAGDNIEIAANVETS